MAKGTIKAKIEIEGASQYKDTLKSIAISEKELQSEMKKTQAQYKGAESSTEALTKKYALLEREIDLQKKKLAEQEKMVQNAAKAQQEYGTKTEKLQKILDSANKETGELTDEQKKAAEALGVSAKTTDDLADAIKKSTAQYDAAGRAMQLYQTEANNTETRIIGLNGELIDISKTLNGVEEESDKGAEGLEEMGDAAAESGKDVKSLGDIIRANLTSAVIMEAAKALVKAIKDIAVAAVGTGSEFEASMSQVAATMGITADAIRSGSEDYQILEAAAKRCGETTKYSASEAAQALNYLALAGYDAAKSAETLPKVLDLAAAGGMELATASDMVTDAMAALGMETSELDKYIDQMTKTAQKSNTSVEQLGEATLVCAGMAKTAGVDLETMNTALGVLANNGIKGAEGGTKLRNVLLSLSAPTDTAAVMLNKLKVSTVDVNGDMRNLESILNDLNAAMADMGTAERAQAIKMIFNKTDISAVNALLKSTNGEFSDLKVKIKDSAGAAAEMAKTMNDNLKGQVTILKSNLEALGISAYQVFDDQLKRGVEEASGAVQRLNESVSNGEMNVSLNRLSTAIGNLIEKTAKLAEDVLPGVISGAAWMLDNLDLIASLIAGIAAAHIEMNVVVPIINAVRASWAAYKAEAEVATIQQWLLNAAMEANPAGILLTAVTALTAGVAAYALINRDAAEEVDYLNEEQRKMVDAAVKVSEETKKSADVRAEERKNMEAQKRVIESLRSELSSYVDANGKVTGSEERVAQIVAELNTLIPELNLSYDETTKTLSMTTDEIDRNIESMLRQAEVTAVQEQLADVLKERVAIETELAKIQDEYDAAVRQFTDDLAAAKQYQDDYNNGLIDSAGAAAGANQAYKGLGDTMSETDHKTREIFDTYSELETRLAELGTEQDILTEKIGSTSSAMDEAGDAVDGYADETEAAAAEIADSWEEIRESVSSSIKSQIDVFAEYEGATKHSVEEVLKNMNDQVTGLREWSTNIEELAKKGIDEGLLQKLMNMGPEGAGYVAAFNEMTGEELQEASKLFEEAMKIPDETIANVEVNYKTVGEAAYKGYSDSLEDGKAEAQEETEDTFKEIGEGVPISTAEGINDKKHLTQEAAEDMAQDVIDSTKTKFRMQPDSKEMSEIGENIGTSLADGIKSKEEVAVEAAREMAEMVKTTMQDNLDTESFYSMGEMAGDGFVNGLLSKIGDVQSAAAQLASIAESAAKDALKIESPSKVFAQIGEYTGEGFVIGFQDSMAEFGAAMNSLIPELNEMERPEIAPSNTITNNFTIYGGEGQDVQEIAMAVQDIISEQYDAERVVYR